MEKNKYGNGAYHKIASTLRKALTWNRRNLKARFDQLYKNAHANQGKNLKLKSAFYKATNKFYRDAWEKWKKAASLLEVIRFNNEEGPVRMETNAIKSQVVNLANLIKQKGLYNDQQLVDLLAYDNSCYRGLAEKSLCRLLVHRDANKGDSGAWVMPMCIDLLKRNVKGRRLAREKLNVIVNALDPLKAGKANTFYLWRRKTMKK